MSILFFNYLFKSKKKNSPFKLYENLIPKTYRIGFTNLDSEIHIDNLPVIGPIPEWLSGVLFRNGPAKFTTNNAWVSNWFDGLAMIHAFSINNGAVSYTNKFLKTDNYETAKRTGNMSYFGFVQDPCKSLFKILISEFITHSDKGAFNNTNINIAKYTEHFIAFSETPLPIEFDQESLETIGLLDYHDNYPKYNIHDTAHPHYDSLRNEHLAYFTKFGKKSSHNLFRIKDGSTKREIIGSISVDQPSYMHSFGLTKNYAILTGLPLVANPINLLLKNKGFIKNFKWKPELGTRFIVFDRINDKLIGTFKGEPFFAFHTVNAFEENNKIIFDIIVYPDASIIDKSYFDYILAPRNPKNSNTEFYGGLLKRFTIDLRDGTVISRIIINEQIELPRINYEKCNTKDYTYMYAYAGFRYPYTADKLLKINVKTGESKSWYQENCYPGEPVFINEPHSQKEDKGVVLSVILNAQMQKSFLLILDAESFKEISRAEVPHHIPFGIHGKYFSTNSKIII